MFMDTLALSRTRNQGTLQSDAPVIWFTGLSGAGKTTLAVSLHRRLADNKLFSVVLDGDELRKGINAGLGFSPAERGENIRRAAEISLLFASNGIICIVSTISPYPGLRANARTIIGPHRFLEIYVSAPLTVCEQRDTKGFYRMARKNQIDGFTGIQDAYVPPENPDLEIRTDQYTIDESVEKIYSFICLKILSRDIALISPASF
jgi:adenylyl-sulfate kinase